MAESEGHSNPGSTDRKETADTSEQMEVSAEHPASDHCIVHEDRNKTQIDDNVQIKADKSEVKHLKHTTAENVGILYIYMYILYYVI